MPVLTTTGSPTFNADSSCTIDATGPDVVSAPSTLVSNSTMWFAARITTTFANTADPYAGGDFRIFQFGTDVDMIGLFFVVATDVWAARRTVAGGPSDASSAGQTFSSGAKFTLVVTTDASNVKLSLNGAAFISTAKAAGAIGDTVFYIGNRADGTRAAASAYFWAAAGTGLLADADAASLNSFGDTDPTWNTLPSSKTFLWTADSTTYLNSAPPATSVATYGPRATRNMVGPFNFIENRKFTAPAAAPPATVTVKRLPATGVG